MSAIGSFPGHTLPNLPCRDSPVLLDQGAEHGLHISFAGFRVSQTDFLFTEQMGRGNRTTQSPQRDVTSSLHSNTKKCSGFLMESRSPSILSSRGMFFPWKWQIVRDKAGQEGWSSHQVLPFETHFQNNLHEPLSVSSFFQALSVRNTISFRSTSPKAYFVSLLFALCNTTYNSIYLWERSQAVESCNRFLQNSTRANWSGLRKIMK